jgi:hypothetical protein
MNPPPSIGTNPPLFNYPNHSKVAVCENTPGAPLSLMVQSKTQNYLNDERYNRPYSTRIEKGLDHRPKRPAIYFKSQGRMFLITAEGIDILRATYFFI